MLGSKSTEVIGVGQMNTSSEALSEEASLIFILVVVANVIALLVVKRAKCYSCQKQALLK